MKILWRWFHKLPQAGFCEWLTAVNNGYVRGNRLFHVFIHIEYNETGKHSVFTAFLSSGLPPCIFQLFSIFAFISVVAILYLTLSFCKLTFPGWPGSLYFRLWGYIWNKSKIMGLVWLEESILTPACGFLRPDQREVRWGEEFVWI